MNLEPEVRNKLSEKFTSTFHALCEESDRGSVLVAACIAEDLIEQCLNIYLIPSSSKRDDLLSSQTSSFQLKIELAYRVGLIRKDVKTILNIIRKLRNEFAHSSHNHGFNKDSVKSYVLDFANLSIDLLEVVYTSIINSPEFNLKKNTKIINKKEIPSELIKLFGYRKAFEIAASINISGLIYTLETIVPIKPLID